MKSKQIRRQVGKFLKKKREALRLKMLEVSAYLESYGVKCSRANLSRIESTDSTIRHDIIAGLALLYDLSADEILFRGKSEKDC